MRLIDADKVCEILDDIDGFTFFAPESVKQLLEEVPTVEPKRGRWVHVGGYFTPGGDPVWRCSECGKGIHVYGIEHKTYGADISDGQWVACPNCGAAMMEGGDDGAECDR